MPRAVRLEDMLSDILGSQDKTDSLSYPVMEAQYMELDKIVRDTNPARAMEFSRGHKVKYKHLVGSIRNDLKDKIAMVFWRYLDYINPADANRINEMSDVDIYSYPEPDCLVMLVHQGTVRFQISQSSFLESAV